MSFFAAATAPLRVQATHHARRGGAISRKNDSSTKPSIHIKKKVNNSAPPTTIRKALADNVPSVASFPNDGPLADDEQVHVTVFSTSGYMRSTQIPLLEEAFPGRVRCLEVGLSKDTAVLATGSNAVCLFVNDVADATTVNALADLGVRFIAMRCAGFDRVDLDACRARGVAVTRVPAYSPYAIAEHAVALMLALNRQIIKGHSRVQQGNYSLSGLVGFDMHGKTVGLVGTGKIGRCTASILLGMGCKVLAHDLYPSEEAIAMGIEYVDTIEELLPQCHIVTLHCPLNESTHHLMNAERLAMMRSGSMLINTSRGALVDTSALAAALDDTAVRRGVACAGLDVYEREGGVFFSDKSEETDDVPGSSVGGDWDFELSSLACRPNVIVTAHQAFLTAEALANIAATTVDNLTEFENGGADDDDKNGKDKHEYTNGVVGH